ncbi:hypothetical protein P3X46_004894 [Hevea brasiliensis]|uniref:B-like cyclin n=1 Tax=Hevea brasiliensis TaxID=3981 RepID=A0ABQ9MY62_HEVBR|nr:putative cyclin-D7-1 [Hevea brasiliensis]KAJ9185237.1 hypothetical protein P3X46_004894 [Hevea brasiliensis]
MESLLCDEVWLSTIAPSTPDSCNSDNNVECYYCFGSFYTTKEDFEQALCSCLQEELTYMPEHGYLEHLHSTKLFFARFKAIQWLIKSRSRLNLSFVTLFNAANYLDRFISMNQSHGWKNWMVELLSVACLSVASKFIEISTPSLQEMQMEDLDHSFQSITIQRMELMLLQALGWRLGSTTAYSYVELLTINIDPSRSHLRKDLVARVTELLLGAILDCQSVECRPSIACASALWCGLQELLPSKSDAHLAYVTGFFNQNQKDDIIKYHKYMMEAKLVNPLYNLVACGNYNYCPSSPVTVLLTERIDVHDSHVDLSLFKDPSGSNNNNLESIKKRRKQMQGLQKPTSI